MRQCFTSWEALRSSLRNFPYCLEPCRYPGFFPLLQVLKNSTHPLASEFLQTLERPIQIIAQLLTENQQLRQKQQSSQDDRVAQLLAENQRLRQELQALKSNQRVPEPQRSPHILANWIPSRWNTSRQKQPGWSGLRAEIKTRQLLFSQSFQNSLQEMSNCKKS